ncbi:hypothetical protein Tco_1354949 [Tanacetum coccineum]
MTVSLVGLPVPTFHFVAGHGNLAPGAPRSQGRHAIAGRSVQGPSVSHGPAPVGHGRGFVDALAIRGPPGREIVLGVPAVDRARDGLGVVFKGVGVGDILFDGIPGGIARSYLSLCCVHGNLAPGAPRSQGRHAIAGRGVQGESVSLAQLHVGNAVAL